MCVVQELNSVLESEENNNTHLMCRNVLRKACIKESLWLLLAPLRQKACLNLELPDDFCLTQPVCQSLTLLPGSIVNPLRPPTFSGL